MSLGIPTPGIVGLELLIEPDTDRDGLPDSWEITYGLNVASNDASLDLDGDGQSNISEFQSGTDPTDADSLLRFQTIISRDGAIVLTFQAVPERRYVIQFQDAVLTAEWQALAEIVGQEDSSLFEIIDSSPQTGARFYRLMIPSQR